MTCSYDHPAGPPPRLEISPKIGIDSYEDLFEPFCREILFDVVDPDGPRPLVTDESSLSRFANVFGGSPTVDDLLARIETTYGSSCSDLVPPLLVRVLERIRILKQS